jgi:hypothetical protein
LDFVLRLNLEKPSKSMEFVWKISRAGLGQGRNVMGRNCTHSEVVEAASRAVVVVATATTTAASAWTSHVQQGWRRAIVLVLVAKQIVDQVTGQGHRVVVVVADASSTSHVAHVHVATAHAGSIPGINVASANGAAVVIIVVVVIVEVSSMVAAIIVVVVSESHDFSRIDFSLSSSSLLGET